MPLHDLIEVVKRYCLRGWVRLPDARIAFLRHTGNKISRRRFEREVRILSTRQAGIGDTGRAPIVDIVEVAPGGL